MNIFQMQTGLFINKRNKITFLPGEALFAFGLPITNSSITNPFGKVLTCIDLASSFSCFSGIDSFSAVGFFSVIEAGASSFCLFFFFFFLSFFL